MYVVCQVSIMKWMSGIAIECYRGHHFRGRTVQGRFGFWFQDSFIFALVVKVLFVYKLVISQ